MFGAICSRWARRDSSRPEPIAIAVRVRSAMVVVWTAPRARIHDGVPERGVLDERRPGRDAEEGAALAAVSVQQGCGTGDSDEARVWRRPSGRRTIRRKATDNGSLVILSSARPSST